MNLLFDEEEIPLHPVKEDRSRQNRSTAVMQRRAATDPDTLDDFPTPSWAVRALCEEVAHRFGEDLARLSVREPAANRGHMVRPLAECFGRVIASDIADYGAGFPVFDYIDGIGPPPQVDWTITNPPFILAEDFLRKALLTSRIGVALLLRIAFLEGVGRHDRIFAPRRPELVLQFSERVVMHRGRVTADGSSATAYAWFIWRCDEIRARTELDWIPPCRARLERPEDYPGYRLEIGPGGRRRWRPLAEDGKEPT